MIEMTHKTDCIGYAPVRPTAIGLETVSPPESFRWNEMHRGSADV